MPDSKTGRAVRTAESASGDQAACSDAGDGDGLVHAPPPAPLIFPRNLEVVGGHAVGFISGSLYTPIARAEELPPELFSLLLGSRLIEHQKLRAFLSPDAAGLEKARLELANVDPSEGTQRIARVLRRTEAFADLDAHDISIDAIPNALPGNVLEFWRYGAFHSSAAFQLAHMDPYRVLDTLLPVGLVIDLKESAFTSELLQSPLYTALYGEDGRYSWLAAYLYRTRRFTWVATMWHTITSEEVRLRVRTALQYLVKGIATACARLGLFSDAAAEQRFRETGLGSFGPGQPRFRDLSTPPLPPFSMEEAQERSSRDLGSGRSRYVRGWQLHCTPELDPVGEDFSENDGSGNLGSNHNRSIVKEVDAPALGEWTREQLETERHRLRAVLAETQRDLDAVERELRTRLEFAGAVPVAAFSATAVRLIEGFEADPRPLIIYVSGTERTAILKPADPNHLPAEVVPISKLGQHGSRLVQQVYENRARSGARIGIRRGGSRTGEVVAELCPPNQRSLAYIAVLREMEELGENEQK